MTDYYVKRMDWFLKPLQEAQRDLTGYLSHRYGSSTAPVLYEEAVRECRTIIATLPDIGGDENPLTFSLVGSAIGLGWYRVLRAHGVSPDAAGRDIYGIFAILMPSFSRHDEASVSAEEIEQARDFCEKTARREYPDNFVADFVPGDHTCEYGMNIRECAVIRLFDRYGARELVPYMCLIDRLLYAARGVGFSRTTTLADGGPYCDFRIRSSPDIELQEPFSSRKLREWGIHD